MKNRDPRLFSMIRTLMQRAHRPGSGMCGCESDDPYLPLRVAGPM